MHSPEESQYTGNHFTIACDPGASPQVHQIYKIYLTFMVFNYL